MQITINEAEIKAGCKRYVADQGIAIEGKEVDVHLVAGRGANGFTATVEFTDIQEQPKSASEPKKEDDITPTPETDTPEERADEEVNEEESLFGN